MDAKELLRTWPEWSHAGAARVMASPAWRMAVRFGGATVPMTRLVDAASLRVGASLALAVRLDDAPHTLDLALSPRFPDLWLLREKLAGLPHEVLLALVEKECGGVFQFVEDTFHCLFALVGVSSAQARTHGTDSVAFRVALPGDPLVFALDLTPEMIVPLGDLDHLDVTHESIRSLATPAWARQATLALTDEEAAALRPGDFLAMDDVAGNAGRDGARPLPAPGWIRELPADEAVQVVAPEQGTLTFAQLADGTLPPVPDATAYDLYRRGEKIATAEEARVGVARALKIVATVAGTRASPLQS